MDRQISLPTLTLPHHVYHLAEASNWPFIQQHGLLSTKALLQLAGLSADQRLHLEQHHRSEQLVLDNGVVIRDQGPMPPSTLSRCLVDMTPYEWYALLNTKVFFWLSHDRLNRMLKANGKRPQMVMVVDTAQLLARYAEQMTLTPFNTGNARRKPAVRGLQTFVPYHTWTQSRWESEAVALGRLPRPRNHQPVELTVADAVPDVMSFLLHIERIEPGAQFSPSLPLPKER